jgi:hypothetical protein
MPTHSYTVTNRPPTVLDHVLAHCFELGLSGWAMTGGALAIFSAFNDGATVSPSMDRLPVYLAAPIGLLLLAGGALIFRGLFDDSDDLMVGWRYERSGLILSIGGWGLFGIIVFLANGYAILSWGLSATVVTASVLRYWATVRSERRTRHDIHQARGGAR